jgi:hypothetical protein
MNVTRTSGSRLRRIWHLRRTRENGGRAGTQPPFDLTRVTHREILEHMFEHFSSLSQSDRDMAQDLLAELIPRQRQPTHDQPKCWGPGWPGPGPADADLK